MSSLVTPLPDVSVGAPTSESYLSRIQASLQLLADRPGLLTLLALALNAVLLPYLGMVHDARLYALQTLNHVHGGAFSNDLFLRYGSQDRFTFFTTLAAPLAGWVGLPTAFFLIYLACRALFLYGVTRLLIRLFGSGPLTALAVLVVAVDPIAFGGHAVFNVNEAFTTPRLPTCGLVLIGLSLLLERRWLLATACFVAGLLLHPLMALAGLAMLVGWAILCWWPERGQAILLGLAGLGLLGGLGIPPLSYRLFGAMDAEWLAQVRLANGYHFPDLWREVELRRIVLAAGAVLLAASLWARTEWQRASFLRLAVLVGVCGLLVTTIASLLGYQLLFQAQPYRMLWVMHLLAIPCCIHLAAWAWQSGSERYRVLAVLGLGLVLCNSGTLLELVLPASFLVLLLVGFRGLLPRPRRPDWFSAACAWSLALGLIAWGLYRVGVIVTMIDQLRSRLTTMECLYVVWLVLGTTACLAMIIGLLLLLTRVLHRAPGWVGAGALALFLMLHATCFAATQTTWFQQYLTKQGRHLPFVGSVLAAHHTDNRPLTIYWGATRVDTVWVQLEACVFFDPEQMAGLIFNRQTSAEGFRRARLVGAFEMCQYREFQDSITSAWRDCLEQIHGVSLDEANPTAEDLYRLANEPGLDYVVVDRDMGCPFLASDGTVFIYDCARLRSLASAR